MRQYLTEQIRQKDKVIESLLQQLQNPYVSTLPSMVASPVEAASQRRDVWFEESPSNGQRGDEFKEDMRKHINADILPIASAPLGLIAHLGRHGHSGPRGGKPDDVDESEIGVANTAYFEPGPAADLRMRARLLEHSIPEIVIHGIVVPEDVDKFHANLNPFICLLDPVLYTPNSTFARCPVLFAVVCAISSRYYADKSEIYPIAMHFAKRSAANALNEGWKTIELCQAYLLLSIYAVQMPNWEQDCSWLFTGVAIRLATELNLNQEPIGTAAQADEKWERELLNRTRVWMNCFIMDHFIATQSGKPPAIKSDYVIRCRSNDWYSRSPYNSAYDLHLCVTTGLLLIIADFQGQIFSNVSPSGLNQDVDFRAVTIAHDAKLKDLSDEWAYRLVQQSNSSDPAYTWQLKLLTLSVICAAMLSLSLMLTGALDSLTAYSRLCLESAKTVLCTVAEGLSPTGLMCYSPNGHFSIITFASAVLLKLLRPEYSHFMQENEDMQAYKLITQAIQALSSSAVDDCHIPKLYAHFLDGLLSRQNRDSPTHGHFHHQQPILRSTRGPSFSNYGDPTSSIFTMSSVVGSGAAADSEQEAHEYQDVYQRPHTAPIPIHRPIAIHPIQYNTEIGLETEPYNEPV
ncbi:hypothetical protein MSAN_00508600 [Mycena sanguinolenta]|uniref:Xylanolytic transcriptional activator regulatory domain-containing protein n=1 Tax=Mycena sanguinolenta TaxID=230812 RepID=A0A8H6Z906_9AGAR|nr:hypothetical protein MSAN_00508600 [Mycena sanguinolenta]